MTYKCDLVHPIAYAKATFKFNFLNSTSISMEGDVHPTRSFLAAAVQNRLGGIHRENQVLEAACRALASFVD